MAFLDFDNDGQLDLLLVNGSRLKAPPAMAQPWNHLYRNLGDGRFTDVTHAAGLDRPGWERLAVVGYGSPQSVGNVAPEYGWHIPGEPLVAELPPFLFDRISFAPLRRPQPRRRRRRGAAARYGE